ncbi:MAG: 1-aminocyclopropane-1-carboxylate deaminase/D-cysteine desulfhydrase [Anaerovoracaceae bacterium]
MLYGHRKISFLNLPTPLEYMSNLSRELGISLYFKRDDLTGPGGGGNKLRKLEYLLGDAKEKGATALITVGAPQTNHGRLTAAVAAKFGMKCTIIAMGEYPGELSANLLLDRMMDSRVIFVRPGKGEDTEETQAAAVRKAEEEYRAAGEVPYFIPMGGSNEIGSLGYYQCAMEIDAQRAELGLENPRVVTAVGSMGTYMGLYSGIRNEDLPLRLTGISVLPQGKPEANALAYYERCRKLLGLEAQGRISDFDITEKYHCGGYNNPVRQVREAIYYVARKEGQILDPCYTGKAFNGLLQMLKNKEIGHGETVIFIHTGGMPGIYAAGHRLFMEEELTEGMFDHRR